MGVQQASSIAKRLTYRSLVVKNNHSNRHIWLNVFPELYGYYKHKEHYVKIVFIMPLLPGDMKNQQGNSINLYSTGILKGKNNHSIEDTDKLLCSRVIHFYIG